MPKVCIAIPIYKTELSSYEKESLEQCLKILKNYPIYFFEPNSLDTSRLRFQYPQIKVIKFDDKYFQSLHAYNELMLKSIFYKEFINYDYILLYQLDAYVFIDKLLYWCNKNCDYIGAPWIASKQTILKKIELKFKSKEKQERSKIFFKVGNGGFSLRKVKSFLEISSKFSERIDEILRLDKKDHKLMEDVFWSLEAPMLDANFLIPDYKEAVNFAIDRRPKLAVKILKEDLPFGCHRVDKNQIIKLCSKK